MTYLGLCPRCGDPIVTDIPLGTEPLARLLICHECSTGNPSDGSWLKTFAS